MSYFLPTTHIFSRNHVEDREDINKVISPPEVFKTTAWSVSCLCGDSMPDITRAAERRQSAVLVLELSGVRREALALRAYARHAFKAYLNEWPSSRGRL